MEEAKYGFCDDVQYGVEYHLACRRDDITAISKPPGNWVKNPDEGKKGCRSEVRFLEVGTKTFGGCSPGKQQNIPDVQLSCTSAVMKGMIQLKGSKALSAQRRTK